MDDLVRGRLRNFAIGAAVQRTRRDRGLDDDRLARQVRVTTQTLLDYESGEEAIPAPKLFEIAEALAVPIEELLQDFAEVAHLLRD